MRADALGGWHAGLRAVDAQAAVASALDEFTEIDVESFDTLVVATGKAAAGMVRGLGRPARGVALLPHGYTGETVPEGVEVLYASHPVPDRAGMRASERILAQVSALRSGQWLVYLVSGGTSSLFEVARPGVNAEDLIETYRLLLGCGAPIDEINVMRRALSLTKGGGLAVAAQPARVLTLAISDVAGEDAAVIGSGPTLTTAVTEPSAKEIAHRYGLMGRFPPSVIRVLNDSCQPKLETNGPCRVLLDAADAVDGACRELALRGYRVVGHDLLGLHGTADCAADRLAVSIADILATGGRAGFVWGGETTVRLGKETGTGGRCRHMALRLAGLLEGRAGFACAVAGTDGRDGTADSAGAIIDGETAERVRRAGYDSAQSLAAFDSGPPLAAVGDAVVTGPTGTNVGDLLVVTVDDERDRTVVLC